MLSRFQFDSSGRAFRFVLGLLLLAVLLPTAALLYFINLAVVNQRNMTQQQLSEAYYGQLRLMAERMDSYWDEFGKTLDASETDVSPALAFERLVRSGMADAVIVLNADGSAAYPSFAAAPRPDPTIGQPRWIEARHFEDSGHAAEAAKQFAAIAEGERDRTLAAIAWRSSIRCLAASGQKQAAMRAIEQHFSAGALANATDLDGRVVAADELLFYVQLDGPGEPRFLQSLHTMLQDYSRPIPAAQRVYLMDEVRAMVPEHDDLHKFPTYSAERTAERLISEGRAVPGDASLRYTGMYDIYKFTSPSRRRIALMRGPTITRVMGRFFVSVPSRGMSLTLSDAAPNGQWVAASLARMPGWRLNVMPPEAGALAGRRIASYSWIGFLILATVATLAGFCAQVLRKQMKIAHLKTDLVAAVSHELKTPLASMKLLVDSLLRGEQFDPVRTRQYLQLVARENARLSRLIDNFLTFSRMERNRGRFDCVHVAPAAVVRDALEAIGDRFAVEVEITPDLPPVYADPDALVTVLLNLLENAYKYTSDDRHIQLKVTRHAGRVMFAVKDNGIGIADRDQKRIFRRFFQVDRQLARQTGGVGLGLSIVEFIVKAHGGTVGVSSRPGAGSTFTVSLPAVATAAQTAAGTAA